MTTGKSTRRSERRITISSIHRDYHEDSFWVRSRHFPMLRFGGAWLERVGFAVGQRVRVQVGKGRIVIEPTP